MRRPERVAAQITRETSEIVKFTLADPQIRLVTVNRAHVSPDLRHATVFVTVLGDAQQCGESLHALQRAARVVRRELSARLRLRYSPELTFQLDPEMVTEEGVRQISSDRSDDTHDDLEILAQPYE
jgi:ribosome-binding factor A